MTALLASVRSSAEALDAAHAGAALIDLKEPGAGSLGGVAVDEIARIVRDLRSHYPVKPISATIGDLPTGAFDEIAARVIDVSNAGVDYVKVGVTPGPDAARCLTLLASLPASVVPVLLSDDGRTLFDCVDGPTLSRCLCAAGARGSMTCVAGSLGMAQLAQIRALGPDIAGFRTALCDEAEGRAGRLDPKRVAQLADALHHAEQAAGVA
jgi:uncharacterized protein (UPF0264 family)